MNYKRGVCNECGDDRVIVNKHYGLCQMCNSDRLSVGKKPPRGISRRAKVNIAAIEADEAVYKAVWDSREHVCEECKAPLGDAFLDSDGRVADRFRYSHIMPKSTYPEHRRNVDNFNLLCLEHHNEWENGDKEKMRIWDKNMETMRTLRMLSESTSG